MHNDDLKKNNNHVEECCETCEFFNAYCMGYGTRTDNGEPTYGMPIDDAIKMFPHGCDDWGISFSAFCDQEDAKEGQNN